MKIFLCAVALSFAFEGILFSLFPETVRKAMTMASEMDNRSLRKIGIIALCTAIILAFYAQ